MMKEKNEVMEMLYKYREVFSLRDEISTCPNIEIEINVTDILYQAISCKRRGQNTHR